MLSLARLPLIILFYLRTTDNTVSCICAVFGTRCQLVFKTIMQAMVPSPREAIDTQGVLRFPQLILFYFRYSIIYPLRFLLFYCLCRLLPYFSKYLLIPHLHDVSFFSFNNDPYAFLFLLHSFDFSREGTFISRTRTLLPESNQQPRLSFLQLIPIDRLLV